MYRSRHRRFSAPAAVFLAALLGVAPLYGFCPTNGVLCVLFATGISHKTLTTGAIRDIDAEFFGATHITSSMRRAMNDIAAANAEVDDHQLLAHYHFDGETFTDGKQRIVDLSNAVVENLHGGDVKSARINLGGLLHTLQDFYAHSDFIEAGGSGSYPALWDPSQPISPLSGLLDSTCQACTYSVLLGYDCSHNLTTAAVTSGYFDTFLGGDSSKPLISSKCRHGGLLDFSVGPAGGINKDTIIPDDSPHWNYHLAAAVSAQLATEGFLRHLRTRLTEEEVRQLLGVGPTLAMAIDTTGSMAGEIASVREEAIQIVDERIGTDEEPGLYVLSPFNDPSVGPLTVTSDPNVFKAAISALTAVGGDDCPELAMSGLLSALGAIGQGGDLFLWTDADAKDGALAGDVLGLTAARDTKIYPFIFGGCGSAGGRRIGQTVPPSLRATATTVDPVYVRLANESGGQIFLLSPAEAGQTAHVADAVVRTNAVDLLAVTDTLKAGGKAYTIPVDSGLTRISFVLTGATGLQLIRPNGTAVSPTDPDVQVTTVASGTLITVLGPAVGAWKATVAGTSGGAFSLAAKGEGTLGFDRFDLVEMRGSAHPGYFPIAGFPTVGSSGTALALLSGPVAAVQFELRDQAGNLLRALSMAPASGGDPNQFLGTFPLPSQTFVVYARGTDSAGTAFQRVVNKPVKAQTLQILAPTAQRLVTGTTASYEFEVKNLGAADTFQMVARDDRGLVSSVQPSQITLTANRKVKVAVRLTVPAGSTTGAIDSLTLSVESTTGGSHNFAVVESPVVSTP